MKPYVVGVDIGGTTVKLGLFGCDGELLDKWEIPTQKQQGGELILPDVAQSIDAKLREREIDHDQVEGIGIGVPGPVDEVNVVHKCVNLGWGVLDVKERMNRLLPGIPNVAAGNDANVAALGELWKGGGQGKGHDSTVMFTLGTGVGGGVVLSGRIVAGTNGGAGEVGHIPVEPFATEQCGCGKCGCLEQYASATGVVKMAKEALAQSDLPSALRGMENFTAREICDLARDGEALAASVVDRCGEYLGRAMSCLACALDPDIFIVGGGMSSAGDVLLDAIRKYYRKYAFHVSANTGIVLAQLGNDAGIYGCAKMIIG